MGVLIAKDPKSNPMLGRSSDAAELHMEGAVMRRSRICCPPIYLALSLSLKLRAREKNVNNTLQGGARVENISLASK